MGVLQLVVAEGNMAILHSSNFTGLSGQFWDLHNRQKSFKNQSLSKFLRELWYLCANLTYIRGVQEAMLAILSEARTLDELRENEIEALQLLDVRIAELGY